MASITQNELMDELSRTLAQSHGPAEAKTAKEIQAETGLSYDRVLLALKAFGQAGRLIAHQVTRPSMGGAGHPKSVPAYTILPVKKKR